LTAHIAGKKFFQPIFDSNNGDPVVKLLSVVDEPDTTEAFGKKVGQYREKRNPKEIILTVAGKSAGAKKSPTK
jgi:hypothetical protein